MTYRWTFRARFNNLFAKSKFLFYAGKNEPTVPNTLNWGISRGVDLILVAGNLEQVASFLLQVWLNILIETTITLHLSIGNITMFWHIGRQWILLRVLSSFTSKFGAWEKNQPFVFLWVKDLSKSINLTTFCLNF